MKKLLLLLALVANGFACNCYAQVIVPIGGGVIINDPDPLDDQGKGNSTQILAIIYQETITVSIDWYAGYADIYVEDEDGIYENLYFSNSDTYMPRTSNGLYKLFEYQNI